MNIQNFAEARKVLAAYIPSAYTLKPTYTSERMIALMERLGDPQNKMRVVHLAGTSGKTSTTYYVASLLQQAGRKVGMTVSPHVDEVNERVQINLEPLPEREFCQGLGVFLDEVAATDIRPSYFELLIAFAYWTFAREGVDYAVVETGLGGIRDATNVVTRADKICILTDIGYDHTEVLGRTLAEISSQKAGIIRPHNVVFTYRQKPEVMEVYREVSRQQQAELHEVKPPARGDLPAEMALFQQRNWLLAYATYSYIASQDSLSDLTDAQLAATMQTYIPARMEVIKHKGKTIIIDASHNPQKMKALLTSVADRYPGQDMAALVSFVKSKNHRARGALRQICKMTNHVIITSFASQQDSPKESISPRKLCGYCKDFGFESLEVVPDPEQALAALLARPERLLLITGSFYLLSHIRPLLLDAGA